MSDEKKVDGQAEQEAPKVAAMSMGFDKDNPGRLIIAVDLVRTGKPMARGFLLEADNLIQVWFAQKDAMSRQIQTPGMIASLKSAGNGFAKSIGLVR